MSAEHLFLVDWNKLIQLIQMSDEMVSNLIPFVCIYSQSLQKIVIQYQ